MKLAVGVSVYIKCTRMEGSDGHLGLFCNAVRGLCGEGNGNPLQCSCLENPRDGGAWWAAVGGVTKSQT